MSNMEIILLIVSIGMSSTTFILTLWYRELNRKLQRSSLVAEEWKFAFEREQENSQKALRKVMELEKKSKLSNDVLAVLNDMKQGGAVFEVTRIDRSDIFFHNGSQYR